MNRELTHHSFKKFHIVIDDIVDDDILLTLESDEENGFGIEFRIKILEIKKIILDLEIIEKNIENNSFTNDDWSIHYSEILKIDALEVEQGDVQTIRFELDHAYLWFPFVNLDELKDFCNIFKKMVLNFEEIQFTDDETSAKLIAESKQESNKEPEKIVRVYRSSEGEVYRIDEEYEKRQQERKLETEKHFEQVIKSANNFIQKTSAEEFENYIIKKISAIPLYDRINQNKIRMDKVMIDVLSETIFADVEDNGMNYGRNQMRSNTLTPIQKKYSDIIDDYRGIGRRSKIIHHAQEEAAKIILEQLKPYEKVTKTLIKVLLVKNEFTKSMADLVYERYQESIK